MKGQARKPEKLQRVLFELLPGALQCTGVACLLLLFGCRQEEQGPERARRLYLANCAPCHGEHADGQGPRSAVLDPKPRDYTDPEWRATATVESVMQALQNGVPGSAMPSWDILPEEDLQALAEYVLTVAESAGGDPPPGSAVPIGAAPANEPPSGP